MEHQPTIFEPTLDDLFAQRAYLIQLRDDIQRQERNRVRDLEAVELRLVRALAKDIQGERRGVLVET
ncbi:MAG: hypothetical protein AB7I19_13590 [Planctomycetota bacterium]